MEADMNFDELVAAAERDPASGGWRLRGRKLYSSNGVHAELGVVLPRPTLPAKSPTPAASVKNSSSATPRLTVRSSP